MRIVAKRGEDWRLAHTGGEGATARGRIIDHRTGEEHPEGNLQTLLAQGYWEPINDGPVVAAAVAAPVRWQAVLAVEGEPTEDGRMLAPGSLTWRDLPIPLMGLTETGPGGHQGAQLAGRIDEIWRDGANVMGSGVFDSGDVGAEIARLVGEQTLRGVSVDMAVREFEVRMLGDDGEPGDEIVEPLDLKPGTDALFVVTDGVIGAATVCPFQAIGNASITIVGSSNDEWRLDRQTEFEFTGPTIDDKLLAAVGTLEHVARLAAELDSEKRARAAAERLAARERDDGAARSRADKEERLALIESLTAQIASGKEVTEAMLAAVSKLTDRKPRSIRVVRDETTGRAVGYEEETT